MKVQQIAVVLASVCGFAFAFAFGAPALAGHDKHGKGGMAHFEAMDADSDGKVTADEHAAGARKMFETMDANKDGKVGVEEMEAAHAQIAGAKAKEHKEHRMAGKGHHAMSAADKIKVVDTNGDGMLTSEEHAAGARTMFEKMDQNKDGTLSKRELKSGHAKMMHKASK